MATLVRSDSD